MIKILGLKSGRYNVISRNVLGTHEVVHNGVHWKLTNRHQTLTAKGPTASNYHIIVFVKDAYQNFKVNVDYYTRKTAVVIYRWGATPWKCNVGRGSAMGTCKRTRKLKCIDSESKKVPDNYCDFNKKPKTEEYRCTNDCPRRNVFR